MEREQDRAAKRPIFSMAIDAIAQAALAARAGGPRNGSAAAEVRCDACDEPIEGEPAGRGLYMWTRGEEVRFEEPALCETCATAIGVTAMAQWDLEDEGD